MFFIGIFGTNSKVVPVGQISGAICPVCGKIVSLNVCRRYSYFHAFFIPVVKYNLVYIATCPSCASVFELSPLLGKRLGQGQEIRISPTNLTLLRNNRTRICSICGASQVDGSLFCNQCGSKL